MGPEAAIPMCPGGLTALGNLGTWSPSPGQEAQGFSRVLPEPHVRVTFAQPQARSLSLPGVFRAALWGE